MSSFEGNKLSPLQDQQLGGGFSREAATALPAGVQKADEPVELEAEATTYAIWQRGLASPGDLRKLAGNY